MSAVTGGFDAGAVVTERHMDEFQDVLSLLEAIGDRIELRAGALASDSLHATLRLVEIAQAKLKALMNAAQAVAPAARPPAA